ncbi:MAG: hypothetical protein AAFR73_12060 [Pseudomonadota bacterium]
MGMDVYGQAGNYFRANIWQWRAMLEVLERSGFPPPNDWASNDGAGLTDQGECDILADAIEAFLKGWDGDTVSVPSAQLAVSDTGEFVPVGTPDSKSPFWIMRYQIEEFVEFLRECDGFEIH